MRARGAPSQSGQGCVKWTPEAPPR
jgi:hypothetical protein